ncbi:hypothetical protein ACROYT_G015758 [Oculina patagonica]
MFVSLLWCLFFGVGTCLGVPNDHFDDKQQELNKALGKAILQELIPLALLEEIFLRQSMILLSVIGGIEKVLLASFLGLKMFVSLLWCLFFGVGTCLGVPNDHSDDKQQELNKALGKAILQELGLKDPPKVTKEQRENVPQHIINLYYKQVNESMSNGEYENEAGELRKGKRSMECRRKEMYVDFQKLYGRNGYIIAPDGFSAYYCNGGCYFPLDGLTKPTDHAILQSLLYVYVSVPDPCCVPTKLSTISVLYFDDNKTVQLKKMENMVAKECGCQ